MINIPTVIQPQPNFPHEDLTSSNAEFIELLVSNIQILEESHQAIEQVSWVNKVGHAAILHSSSKLYDSQDRIVAINHGITSFEAIKMLVNGGLITADKFFEINSEAAQLASLNSIGLNAFMDQAIDSLKHDTPRTAEVVQASVSRFHGYFTSYALLGAAMSREFELRVV